MSVCIVTFLRHGWSRQPTLVFWARFLPTHTHTVVFIYLFIFIKKNKWIKFEYKLPTSSVSLLLSIINFDFCFSFFLSSDVVLSVGSLGSYSMTRCMCIRTGFSYLFQGNIQFAVKKWIKWNNRCIFCYRTEVTIKFLTHWYRPNWIFLGFKNSPLKFKKKNKNKTARRSKK